MPVLRSQRIRRRPGGFDDRGVRGVHGVGKRGGSATCADRIC
ncbi:hypothetical protein V6Z11_D08G279500 [Gossypium hirsutum]